MFFPFFILNSIGKAKQSHFYRKILCVVDKQTVDPLSGPPQHYRRNYSITAYLHVIYNNTIINRTKSLSLRAA